MAGGAASPTWLAGEDTLVVAGDSIDKVPQSIEVLDDWMALEPSTRAAGGHLVVLMGNHEDDFLADPTNSTAAALDSELASRAVMPAVFASTADPHGRWLHERPVAAIVDGWFFSHAGQSGGLSADQLAAEYRRVVDAEAWSDPFLSDANSILNARNWWPTSGTRAYLDANLAALPAQHIVFGHRPITFSDPPSGEIEAHSAGRLVLVDVGMSRAVDYSTGRLLRIDAPGTASEAVAEVTPAGAASPIDMTAR